MSFKIGEVVKLKSGGPLMTVTGISTSEDRPPSLNCSWFDKDNREQVGSFPADALVVPAAKQPTSPRPEMTTNTRRGGSGTDWIR
jgi:uncharacterized protein YodC (DUF2158 family)